MSEIPLSSEIIHSITNSMLPEETREQMVERRLREDGIFCYMKLASQPLPQLPPESGLKIETGGVVSVNGPEGVIDSFLVYDPRRIEIRIREDEKPQLIGRGRRLNPEYPPDRPEDGWRTPFRGSLGRVVSYRPIQQPNNLP